MLKMLKFLPIRSNNMLYILRKILLFLLFLIYPVFSINGQVSIKSSVDRDVITIGDLIHYQISVTHSKDVKVEYPGLGVNLGAFEIRDYATYDPKEEDGNVISKVEYVITTFDTGNYIIPSVAVEYFSSDSVRKELKTDVIKIRVNSVKPSEAKDIKDIKPPLEIKIDYRRYIYYGLVGLVIIGLIIGVIWYLKKRKKGEGVIPKKKKPLKPAHIIAIEELEELKNSNLLSERKFKEFYIIISNIIRCYIENRYFIYALEMTTNQVCENLYNAIKEVEIVELVQEFLSLCDLVKFAKYIPEEDENKKIVEQAFEIVNKTKIELMVQPIETNVQ